MFRTTSLIIAAAMLFASACSSETGLLIEVTRAPAAEGLAELEQLEFFVGTDDDSGIDVFLPDPDELLMELGAQRDILDRPARILLRVGDFGDQVVADTDVIVAVVAHRGGQAVGWGALPEPVRFVDGEVRKYSVTLGRDPVVSTDGGCTTIAMGMSVIKLASENDKDCDGDLAADDCDDRDPKVGPSQGEKCGNAKDDDCDELIDEEEDNDGDQVTNCAGDCNDNDATVAPGLDEVCDGVDNNCDGSCDEGFADADGDGYLADCASVRRQDGTCRETRPVFWDCNDGDDDIHPERDDPCDGVDNNCNYLCDDDPIPQEFDKDRDGFATCLVEGQEVQVAAGPGLTCVSDKADCNPEDPLVFPGAPELCDGKDNDCDTETLFVGEAPCINAEAECLLGESACDDNQDEATADQGPTGDCTPIAELEPLDPDICAAAEQCNTSDPFTCSLLEASPDVVHCTQYLAASDGASDTVLCPKRGVFVPTKGLMEVTCSWTLLQVLGNYEAFWSGGDSSNTILNCDAILGIETIGPPITPGVLFVNGTSGTESVLYQISIVPKVVPECPEQGLQCESPWDAAP